jgi:heat shock protein HtpX
MNKLRTTIFLGLLTGLALVIGYFIGGQSGALIALLFSAFINFSAYWWSDKIVLMTYNAQEAEKKQHAELFKITEELTLIASMTMPRLYIMKTPMPNAFATGRNEKHAIIAVTTGLLQQLNSSELRGVIAHELAHIKNKDMLIGSIAATFAGAISYLAQLAYFGNLFSSSDNEEDSNGLFGGLIMLILAPIISTLLHLAISRSREYLADESGAKLAGNPEGLANALEKISIFSANHELHGSPKQETAAHLFIINPFKPSSLMALFSTHPPVEERIKRLRDIK